jgi:hypothetical protein
MLIAMETILASVARDDHDAFRRGAPRAKRPIAQLIRNAMALHGAERLEERSRLVHLPVVVGHRPVSRCGVEPSYRHAESDAAQDLRSPAPALELRHPRADFAGRDAEGEEGQAAAKAISKGEARRRRLGVRWRRRPWAAGGAVRLRW